MSNRLTRGSAPNRAREASQRPDSFGKGHAKMGGRKRGTPNVVTRELKVAIIWAAHRLGSDLKGKDGVVGYLTRIAKDDIKTFVMLLRAVLPLQLKARTNEYWPILDADGNPYLTADGEPRYPTCDEILESLGISAAEAMRAAGSNSRLERLPEIEGSDVYRPEDAGGDRRRPADKSKASIIAEDP
jgi:hypothetical protein